MTALSGIPDTDNQMLHDLQTNGRKADHEMSALIIGAGLCGLATAIGFRKAGIRTTVLERSSELREVGAGIQIPPNAASVLHRLGVFDSIREVSVQPHDIKLWSYANGSMLHSLNLNPYTQDTYGYPLLVTHRADLCSVLYQKALDEGAEVRFSCDVKNVDIQQQCIELSTGEVLSSDLIIGADGARSIFRSELVDQPNLSKSTGKWVKRVCLDIGQMHQDPILRELVDPNRIHIWLGPLSHIVCYGLQGIFNVVIIQPGHEGVDLDVQPADLSQMRSDFQTWEPRVRRILEVAKDALQWPLLDSFLVKNWSNKQGSFALVGDAACTVLPPNAQGAAAGFESAYLLAELVSKAKNADELPELLQVYSKARWQRTSRIRELSHYSLQVLEMPDSSEQAERDAQLRGSNVAGNPFVWADPEIQSWLWGFNTHDEANKLGLHHSSQS